MILLTGCKTIKQKTDAIVEKENQTLSKLIGKSLSDLQIDLGKPDEDFKNEQNPLISDKYERGGIFNKLKKWMDMNAKEYGFHLTYDNEPNRKGFEYEPWHYSYKPSSLKYYNALINADLKKIINNPDLKGHYYFTESFINKYISENIMDINPDLK